MVTFIEISRETLICVKFPDKISPDLVFANGGAVTNAATYTISQI